MGLVRNLVAFWRGFSDAVLVIFLVIIIVRAGVFAIWGV